MFVAVKKTIIMSDMAISVPDMPPISADEDAVAEAIPAIEVMDAMAMLLVPLVYMSIAAMKSWWLELIKLDGRIKPGAR